VTKHHYNGCILYYKMLARPVGRFFTVLRMNFPVMLIAEDICGRRLGLCRCADIGIGLASLVCPYLLHTGYRHGQTGGTSAHIFSPCATNMGKRIISMSTRIRSHCLGNNVTKTWLHFAGVAENARCILVLLLFGESRQWVTTHYCRDRSVVRWSWSSWNVWHSGTNGRVFQSTIVRG